MPKDAAFPTCAVAFVVTAAATGAAGYALSYTMSDDAYAVVLLVLLSIVAGVAVALSTVFHRKATRVAALLTQQSSHLEKVQAAQAVHERTLSFCVHEIRNPLHVISAALQFATEQAMEGDSASVMRDLKCATDAAAHLHRLVNDVLDLRQAKQGSLSIRPQPCSVGDVLAATVQSHVAMCDLGVGLKLEVGADVPRVRMDAIRIRQLVANGLTNAIKATPQGTIIVSCTRQAFTATTATLLFQVTDSGPGLGDTDGDALFAEFAQLPASQSKQPPPPPLPRRPGGPSKLFTWTETPSSASARSLIPRPSLRESKRRTVSTAAVSVPEGKPSPESAPGEASVEVPPLVLSPAVNRCRTPSDTTHTSVDSDLSALEFHGGIRRASTSRQTTTHEAARAGRGTGLGLSVCAQLVARMGGRIGLRNRGDAPGAVFWFSLELDIAEGEERMVTPVLSPAAPRKQPFADVHALVVDDEQVNLLIAGRLLSRLGCAVTSASTGRDALSALVRNREEADAAPISVVLCDIMLGEMSGLEVVRHAKHNLGFKTPFVAMTGKSDDSAALRAAGFDRLILTKPFNLKSLRAVLTSVLHP